MKQFRVVEDASVRSETNLTSSLVAELHAGDEVGIRKAVKVSGVSWCAVTLPDGRVGYVAPPFRGIVIRPVTLAQGSVSVFDSPGSNVNATYTSGEKFTITGVVKQGDTQWVEIRTAGGEVAFIPAGTKIKDVVDPIAQNDKNLVTVCAFVGGGVFFVLNLALGGAVVGGAQGGALGGFLGAIVGMVIVSRRKKSRE